MFLLRPVESLFLRSLDAVLESQLSRVAVDRVLSSELFTYAVDAALRGPLMDTALVAAERAIDTPAARRLVAHAIESEVLDEAVTRLLESKELWMLVDEVARSPAVTEAISHQGAGLADQVAAVVRDRSRNADARLERAARRVLRPGRRVATE
jgi:hypothetical protein